MRSLAFETATLPNHLYTRGFLGGRHSDISVKVFDHVYPLHRIVLDRAPFFASALSEPWSEASQKEIELHPEDVDSNITKSAFELALKRLYGCRNTAEEDAEASGLFATGCWLEMQDLVDASVDSLLRRMHVTDLARTVQLVTANYYGKSGDKILASAKAMLTRDGWEMPLRCWDGIPSDLIREIVGGDGFFVYGEWDRWVLAKRLLDRRLKTLVRDAGLSSADGLKAPDALRSQCIRSRVDLDNASGEGKKRKVEVHDPNQRWLSLYKHSDVAPLLALLDEGVHYMHLDFEQLQFIRSTRDALGVPIMPEKIISDSLWAGLELRQKVLNAREKDLTLSLSQAAEFWTLEKSEPSTNGNTKTSPAGGDAPRIVSAQPDRNGSGNFSESSPSAKSKGRPRRFWIPGADCHIVVFGNSEPIVTTSGIRQQIRGPSSPVANHSDNTPWFSDLFTERSTTPTQGGTRPMSYSAYPPLRFAAEFPNPHHLKERKRVYSRTVFYAGSFWNVYIQKVKSGSKNPQLGVYLHRAKDKEPEESGVAANGEALTVDERIGALEREMIQSNEHRSRRQAQRRSSGAPADVVTYSAGFHHHHIFTGDPSSSASADSPHGSGLSTFMTGTSQRRSVCQGSRVGSGGTPRQSPLPPTSDHVSEQIDSSSAASSESEDSDNATQLHHTTRHFQHRPYVSTMPPYIDMRPTIKTYFKIFSPSKGGRLLSVYESAPDNFNFSQSWGWKSSTLMADDESPTGSGDGIAEIASGGLTSLDNGIDEDSGGILAGLHAAGEAEEGRRKTDGKLRFMVVLGVV